MSKSEKCEKCDYSTRVICNEYGRPGIACVYILFTGMRRPCPPGDSCTVFKQREGQGMKKMLY